VALVTGFLGISTFGTQLLQPDDEAGNSPNFIWDRVPGGSLTDDFRWPRSRLGSGTGVGLFTNSLDASRPIWDWYAWLLGSAAMGQKHHSISGITLNSAGAVVGSATVILFRTADDTKLDEVTSDPTTGAFTVTSPEDAVTCYLVSYQAGSPDITGATVNTIVTSYSG
jgi:hypothetical protein